jgi:hypothetical protein
MSRNSFPRNFCSCDTTNIETNTVEFLKEKQTTYNFKVLSFLNKFKSKFCENERFVFCKNVFWKLLSAHNTFCLEVIAQIAQYGETLKRCLTTVGVETIGWIMNI